jgi:carbon-monoxide dehydrogenase iron sulfur subunit
MDKTIVVDIKKCLACKSCEIACALAHSKSKEIEKAVTESPRPQRMVTVEAAGEFSVPIQCRHCEDALCIEICPTGAIQRENEQSPVLINKEMCIGCKLCVLICPFGVLQIGRQGRAIVKCDMCYERAKEGKLPMCVEACPTKALKQVSLQETTKSKRRASAEKMTAKEKEL